ncbi:MAG TPA: hypothetical protein VKG84_09745 [Candidatus Acidoferrales bacterium]|nr:hypothetical protein [Candidatus Acidoferrales bacterium]
MNNKKVWIATAVLVVLGFAGAIFAQGPVVNIDRNRHGNMAAAQRAIVQAYAALQRAQQANDDQLGGHAGRAKELLVQADEEVRLAADVANEHRR